MNNKNKKSTELWTRQLFSQSGAAPAVRRGKTYFAHRYHDDPIEREQTPFSALFSGAGKAFFEQESTADNAIMGEMFETSALNKTLAPEGRAYPASDKALSTPFTVLNCYDETPDTKTYRLARPSGSIFDYLPGQYITLAVVISGQEYKRSYSLASTPSHRGILDITVKRDVKGGVVSNWLNDNLKIGDTVNVKGPFGKFSCANPVPQKILFLAAGSGIVPIMSMLRWLADTEARVDVMLLLSFRSPEDIIYSAELNLIAARHNNIHLAITLTTDAIALTPWSGLSGRINEKMIAEHVPDVQERAVYLCGPEVFMMACKNNLLNLALPTEQLFCESFSVNSPVAKAQDCGLSLPSRKKTGNYQIRFAKSGKTIAADGQMTLLELAEKSGIMIDHECRAGACGECMVKCLKGNIEMTDQVEIADLDRKKGWVYACCAYPASHAVLDI
ncbi:Stearoyl-CoA 9-desaturase electron transfer partner [Crenothrix polyspora]|uniref:Stearoyl-CoA 9-desaturase electron transfer partner n=1 Tax=Crenothrix polyspora TaxID=360316 RepID=A0A1R4H9K9_9GAMM|nr:hybrid-cluster NAD(P)-dependent oxidoreductase [Crenothrix polyspora]SJM92913.1 Stearoyl-CoA 9-desaturase electron transfer partner [Crenothrix polyspora]